VTDWVVGELRQIESYHVEFTMRVSPDTKICSEEALELEVGGFEFSEELIATRKADVDLR
jgi:hypothetical protein